MRLLILLFILPSLAIAGELTFRIGDLPEFYSYKVQPVSNITTAEDVVWSSHEEAWNFRTRLRAGLKEPPTFAGKYVIVTHGCGTNCQISWILDKETGKVVDQIHSSLGLEYHLDSNLIVVDADEDPNLLMCSYLVDEIRYYTLEADKLSEIASLKLPCFEVLND